MFKRAVYIYLGAGILMLGATVSMLYHIKQTKSILEEMNKSIDEASYRIDSKIDRALEGIDGKLENLEELTYLSQSITIPRSITEARKDIERVNNGKIQSYDLFSN